MNQKHTPQSKPDNDPPKQPEVPAPPPPQEFPGKPDRDVPQPDRERAESEGMADQKLALERAAAERRARHPWRQRQAMQRRNSAT